LLNTKKDRKTLAQIVDPETRASWEPKTEYSDYILTEHHENSADLFLISRFYHYKMYFTCLIR